MSVTLKDYKKVSNFLEKNEIKVVLYGSLGVSVYLGNFKEFDDVDFLIGKEWFIYKWNELVTLLNKNDFTLFNKDKREFINKQGLKISFTENESFKSIIIDKDGIKVRTLLKDDFLIFYKKIALLRNKESDLYIIKNLEKIIDKEIPNNWEELVELMDFIGDCTWDIIRFPKDQKKYEDYKSSMSREEFIDIIKKRIKNNNPVILKNDFPYSRTLSRLPGVKQYVLWSSRGKISEDEIRSVVKNDFGNKRWCWVESSLETKSVPEIWHCHIFVDES